ncbi:glycine, alanine and asparagine-rich protein-like [Contarinia nasturtii]|uniref:glycine, alanine and asparagine-rich protein-like n=1 Tax=Contarinia nasturtii TaxID=265458 RepID=UPI0012D42E3E|nr:glycine, alanine and asparagine-rich protein-like [Contarinia nasturtii]
MKVFIVSCMLMSVALAQAVPSGQQPSTFLQECFDKDSISCVQTTIYRRAREFFDQPSIKFVGGLSFAKSNERAGKSLEPEPQVEEASSVQARELALEDYLLNRVKNFFTERSVSWDFATAGRSLANAIPDEVKESVRALVVEGRTKKKIIKKLLPLLGLLKLKLAALAVLAIAGIAIIAKKALITSLIAIAIAGAGALSGAVSKLLGRRGGAGGLGGWSQGSNVEEIIAYTNTGGNSGWNSGNAGWNNYDSYAEHGAHSQPVAQQIAYSGHKVARQLGSKQKKMKVFVVVCALLSVAVAQSNHPLQGCFEKDSISCVQQMVYRSAREFFDQPSIQMFSGVSFAKTNARAAKSLEPQVEQAATVQEREVALEDYLVSRAKNFFSERQLTWDVASTGRAISEAIPVDVKESVYQFVEEARTTKKVKLLKKLLPFLGLLKLKLAGFAVLAVAAIGLLAKKALITSFIAIALAGASFLSSVVAKLFGVGGLAKGGAGLTGLAGLGGLSGLGGLGGAAGLGGSAGGLGGLFGGAGGNGAYNNANVEEIVAYTTNAGSSGGNGWNNNGWSNNGWEEQHGSHSQPIAQVLAYNGQRPKTN